MAEAYSNYTIALIKSAAVGRGHALPIMSLMTQKGFIIRALEMKTLCRNTISAFYAEHAGRPYFEQLVGSLSKDVVCLVLGRQDGQDVISTWRAAMGSTDSKVAAPDTIRRKFGGHVWRGNSCPLSDNAVHGSDSPKAAAYEYKVLFNGSVWPKNPDDLFAVKA